jgi:hypothetical protein
MFKLGVMVTDKASRLRGCLMHMMIQGTPTQQVRWYNFQPARLHAESGMPADRSWVSEDRIEGEEIPDPADLPLQTLGTHAEDTITGFSGTVTSITVHASGCVHLELQPKGSESKTGKMLGTYDFDIRRLKGKAIPVLTERQAEASRKKKPSPSDCGRPTPRPM